MTIKYNFPETVHTHQVSNRDQINQILSKIQEVLKEQAEHTSPVNPDLLDEITDLFHSIETFIRMNEKAFKESFTRVFRKNKARGYYWKKYQKDPENWGGDEPFDPSLQPGKTISAPKENPTPVKEGYVPLYSILIRALAQAQSGKGSERHGQGLPFEEQPIVVIPRLQNSDIGLMYQAIKKLQESQRMDTGAAVKERLGAINYIAASIMWLEEREV